MVNTTLANKAMVNKAMSINGALIPTFRATGS